MRHIGIYIHIPFCKSKCIYCDFYSITDTSSQEKYIQAVIKQIKSFKRKAKGTVVDSIYFGGGTPSIIKPEYIYEILSEISKTFTLASNCEISMEMNPGTVTSDALSRYKSYGINRLSMGLQSAHNTELRMLGRIHSRQDFENSFAMCRIEGFDNINVDLMYGLPYQKPEYLLQSIEYTTSLNPEHISLYGLKVEPNTPLASKTSLTERIPDENTQYQMYMQASEYLEKNGYAQYEISNFAKQGKQCRHNLIYWHSREYIGFGAGASSYFNDELYSYVKNVDSIIENPTDLLKIVCDVEKIDSNKEKAKQYLMLAFRLTEGINVLEYAERFNLNFENEYGKAIEKYVTQGFMQKTQTGYRLTKKGFMVSNFILSDILDFTKKE